MANILTLIIFIDKEGDLFWIEKVVQATHKRTTIHNGPRELQWLGEESAPKTCLVIIFLGRSAYVEEYHKSACADEYHKCDNVSWYWLGGRDFNRLFFPQKFWVKSESTPVFLSKNLSLERKITTNFHSQQKYPCRTNIEFSRKCIYLQLKPI